MSRNVFIGSIATAAALAVMPALAQTSSSTSKPAKTPAAQPATKLCSVLKTEGDLTAAPPKCIADPASTSVTPSTAPFTSAPDVVKEDAQSPSRTMPSDTTSSTSSTKKPAKY